MKLLLPVDGSDYTKRMLGYVAAHEELLGRAHEYVFVTVVVPVPAHMSNYVGRAALEDFHRSQAEEVLEPVRAFARQNRWTFRDLHVVGHPAAAIASLADKEQPDLIVMGSHGHGVFAGLVLGSVATGVLARCKAPVLLIR